MHNNNINTSPKWI